MLNAYVREWHPSKTDELNQQWFVACCLCLVFKNKAHHAEGPMRAVRPEYISEPQTRFVYELISECKTFPHLLTKLRKGVREGVFKDWREGRMFVMYLVEEFAVGDAICRGKAHEVIEGYRHRKCAELQGSFCASDPTVSVDDVMFECEERIKEIRALGKDSQPTIEQLSNDLMERICQSKEQGHQPEVGVFGIDKSIGGLSPDENTVIGACTSVGKSFFTQRALHIAAKQGYRCVLYTQEMSAEKVIERFVVMECKIPWEDIKEASGDTMSRVSKAVTTVSHLPIDVVYTKQMSVEEIEADCLRRAKKGVDIVAFDYVQIMRLREKGKRSREEEVSEVAQRFRELGARVGAHSIVCAQLNDTGNPPLLKDIRESKAPGHHADNVILIDKGKGNTLNLYLRKCRNGSKVSLNIDHYGPTYSLGESRGI